MKNNLWCKEVYIDNSATSRFKPYGVYKKMFLSLAKSANAGRGSHCSSLNTAIALEDCRNEIAALCGDGNVIFTKNCTEALNIAILGLPLNGNVVTTTFEHNSVLRPLNFLEKNALIKTKIVIPQFTTITAKEVTKLADKDTSLIVMAENSNVTGAHHEWEEVAMFAKNKGIPFMLDCAQSIGHCKSDYSNVDAIACSGHKGLHGPQGTGFLYFKRHLNIEPLMFGGTGTESFSPYQPKALPEALESGTVNSCGFLGLAEGIKWTRKNIDKIIKKERTLSSYLIDELSKISNVKLYSNEPNGVISFNIGDISSVDIAAILSADYNISVRPGLHCAPLTHKFLKTEKQGAVRASIGYNNSYSDIETLVNAVNIIAKRYN